MTVKDGGVSRRGGAHHPPPFTFHPTAQQLYVGAGAQFRTRIMGLKTPATNSQTSLWTLGLSEPGVKSLSIRIDMIVTCIV